MHFHTIDHFLFETTPAKELGLMAFSGFEDLFALCHTFLATTKNKNRYSLQTSKKFGQSPTSSLMFFLSFSVLQFPPCNLVVFPFPVNFHALTQKGSAPAVS